MAKTLRSRVEVALFWEWVRTGNPAPISRIAELVGETPDKLRNQRKRIKNVKISKRLTRADVPWDEFIEDKFIYIRHSDGAQRPCTGWEPTKDLIRRMILEQNDK